MNSVYNILNLNTDIWLINENLQIKDLKDITDKQKLKIKSNKDQLLKKKEFILTKDNLYFIEKNKIKAYFNYNYIGLKYNNLKKKLVLFNNNNYFNLYFEDYYIYKKWKKIFKKNCILNNFHKKYIFSRNLGSGGNSEVKLCKNLKNQKLFAAKIIPKSKNNNILINEIDIMKNLEHINIVKFIFLYENELNFIIILEYCNNLNLLDYLNNNFLKKYEKLDIIKQILNGLSYLHSKKIVHRDIKPNNIFIHKNNSNKIIVKIGDFGLSNFLDRNYIFKKCGTAGFMAPEIINYKEKNKYKISTKVDIYSFGHLFYFIFTKVHLFRSNTWKELINMNKTNSYKFKIDFNSYLRKIIENCLIDNPKSRININSLEHLVMKVK